MILAHPQKQLAVSSRAGKDLMSVIQFSRFSEPKALYGYLVVLERLPEKIPLYFTTDIFLAFGGVSKKFF